MQHANAGINAFRNALFLQLTQLTNASKKEFERFDFGVLSM